MFRRKPPEPTLPLEWIIVGLGNPGPQYKGTRHNVGFEVVERLADRHRIKLDKGRSKAITGQGQVEGVGALLMKPLTYMNLSGQSVGPLARQLGIGPQRILVIADDLDMVTGKVRLREKGSSGGHNGHKSLIQSLGTEEYPRIKIGIGNTKGETIDHVLSRFTPDERSSINDAIELAVRCIEALLRDGWSAGIHALEKP